MNDWYATAELRFIWRIELIDQHTGRKVKVLQQLWENYGLANDPEWRDVPTVENGDCDE